MVAVCTADVVLRDGALHGWSDEPKSCQKTELAREVYVERRA